MLGAMIGSYAGCAYSFTETASENFDFFMDSVNTGIVPHVFSTAPAVALAIKETGLKEADKALLTTVRKRLEEYENEAPASGILSLLPVARLSDFRENLSGGKGRPDYFSAYNLAHASLEGWLYDGLAQTRRAARIHARLFAQWSEELTMAEVVASVVFLARICKSKDYIQVFIQRTYGADCIASVPSEAKYPTRKPTAFCKDAVAQAVAVFLAAGSFEEAIRLSERCGGTFGVRSALVGAMAEAYYGVPETLSAQCKAQLSEKLKASILTFDANKKPQITR